MSVFTKIAYLFVFIFPQGNQLLAQITTPYGPTNWSVIVGSRELIHEGSTKGRLETLIDDDSLTFWPSYSNGTLATYPHTFIFDMKQAQPVNQLYYIPRNNSNSSASSRSVSFSDGGNTILKNNKRTDPYAVDSFVVNLNAM